MVGKRNKSTKICIEGLYLVTDRRYKLRRTIICVAVKTRTTRKAKDRMRTACRIGKRKRPVTRIAQDTAEFKGCITMSNNRSEWNGGGRNTGGTEK